MVCGEREGTGHIASTDELWNVVIEKSKFKWAKDEAWRLAEVGVSICEECLKEVKTSKR